LIILFTLVFVPLSTKRMPSQAKSSGVAGYAIHTYMQFSCNLRLTQRAQHRLPPEGASFPEQQPA